MKKATLLTLLTIAAIAVPLQADERERHQSFISYDDGGTLVRTGDENREVEAHRNLPIYPGDELITGRRGRTEVHLSDGNIIGVDRASALRFKSILDSYDTEDTTTVAELRYGKVAVYRTDVGQDYVRLDTENASYVAANQAIYSVETDSGGRDRVTVFDGSIEVRTPRRSTRLRAGETATVDDRGVYDLIGDQRSSADDFERWFLKRSERYGNYDSRYITDRRVGYYSEGLDEYGRWVNVSGIGWSWRPIVSVGWRPYFNGYWSNRHGCLTWVSYDPWGWGPYHYGRWAFDPFHGWIWVPGYGYSPAWVYWMYGPSYVGWAPAGWWDCHRGYYDWAYRPYRRASIGFGFYGRVRVNDLDLRPWTFIDSNNVISNRIDRAALTTDAVKARLGRNRDGFANISGGTRFTREEVRDPAAAIRRRGLGNDTSGATGVGSVGTIPDMTPYFRRDPNPGSTVRDRIVRGRVGDIPGSGATTPPSRNLGGGGVAPITGGGLAPIGRGSVAPIDRGNVAPIGGGSSTTPPTTGSGPADAPRDGSGRINRGSPPPAEPPREPVRTIDRDREEKPPAENRDSGSSSWRDRLRDRDKEQGTTPPQATTPPPAPSDSIDRGSRDNSWRSRPRSNGSSPDAVDRSGDTGRSSTSGSDVPRRVIDRIGGARISPRDSDSGSTTRDSGSRDRSSTTRDRSTKDSGSRSSGERPSSVKSDSGRSSSPPPSSGSRDSGRSSNSGSKDSGNRESGGKIKRDQ